MSGSEFTIAIDGTEVTATWTDESPRTRRALADALPFSGEATRWGDELYFRIPVDVDAEDPRTTVDPGTVAYWPRGSALCVFWGPTPASTGPEPKAASPVNVVGRIPDLSPLAALPDGAGATVELSE